MSSSDRFFFSWIAGYLVLGLANLAFKIVEPVILEIVAIAILALAAVWFHLPRKPKVAEDEIDTQPSQSAIEAAENDLPDLSFYRWNLRVIKGQSASDEEFLTKVAGMIHRLSDERDRLKYDLEMAEDKLRRLSFD